MLFEGIKKIVAEQLNVEEESITMDTDIQEDLGADSLDLFQIISDIEDEFEVKFEETDGMKTIGDVVGYVEKQQKD